MRLLISKFVYTSVASRLRTTSSWPLSRPVRDLELLDVAALLDEPQEVNEFGSLDLAVNMLFLAGEHSYPITRVLSLAARSAGFDGLVYPSYFSMLRNGVKPFETTYGNLPPEDSWIQGIRAGENIPPISQSLADQFRKVWLRSAALTELCLAPYPIPFTSDR